MFSGVSHEINSPLSIIQMTAQRCHKLLKKDPMPIEKTSEKLNIIISVTESLFSITKGLDYFSSNVDDQRIERVKVGDLIYSVIEICSPRFSNLKVKIETDQLENKLSFFCYKESVDNVPVNLIEECAYNVASLEKPWVFLSCESDSEYMSFILSDSSVKKNVKFTKYIENPFK